MTFKSINPFDGAVLAEFEELTAIELDAKLDLAASAARAWRARPIAERAAVVAKLGDLLEADKERIGRLMTMEMGKPLSAAIEEAAKCAAACRFYAERGPSFVTDEPRDDEAHASFVAYDPLGVILAVMPWNFPFWQVVRFLAPALTAGNVGLLKHASNVPQCALELESLVMRAGAPEGVFQTLLISADKVAGVIGDARVAAVTLTGSEGAGRSVASAAGAALKKTVLELGGSDPFIVMASANLSIAVPMAVKARTMNNGQSCICAKRFIVHRDIADRFLAEFSTAMRALRTGDPLDEKTQLGPLASVKHAEDVQKQVDESVAKGARIVCGGARDDVSTAFYPATVITDIIPGSPAYDDEIFGPVACVFVVNDIEAAIHIANDTRFGLGSSVWTADDTERERFIRAIDAGSVFVNDMVASDPRFPFGGIKASGYGRELSDVGMREFVNLKTVRIRTSA